jgi:adenylate kinase family enzyme
MSTSIERFNKYILKLVDIIDSSTDLDKSYIKVINDFYDTTLKSFPTVLLDYVGPVLKKNNTYIQEQDDLIIDKIIDELKSSTKDTDETLKQKLEIIIETLQNKWKHYSIEEKNIIFKIFKILVKEYNNFIN